MTELKKSSKADLVMFVHIVVITAGIVIAVNLAACQKQASTAIPEPDKELVQAMLDYCRVGELPRDKWLEAQRAWGFQNGGNTKVMPMWNKAARDKDPTAKKIVRRAADLAMGPDKCPILDVLDRPERLPPKSTTSEPGSAAP